MTFHTEGLRRNGASAATIYHSSYFSSHAFHLFPKCNVYYYTCSTCNWWSVSFHINSTRSVAGGGPLRWIMQKGPSASWLSPPSPSKSLIWRAVPLDDITWFTSSHLPSLRCVTASASMTQQLLSGRAPRLRPFRVTNADRSLRKGIMADTLQDLINKVRTGCEGLKVQREEGQRCWVQMTVILWLKREAGRHPT